MQHLLPLAALLAVVGGGVPHAAGQQTFELDDTDQWQLESSPAAGTPAGQLDGARRALASGQDERAEFLATQWIERYPDSPLLPEAYLLRGDALRAREDYYLALFDYEYVARTFTGSEAFVQALERELEIAQLFISGTRRRLFGMRIVGATSEAEELLIRIQERLPGSRLAEEAALTLGDYYFSERDMDLAAEMYALFIENYPRSTSLRKVRRRLIYAYLASFKGPEFDAAGLDEARVRLQRLRVVDPVTAERMGADLLLARIDESKARKLLTSAEWYLQIGDPISAEFVIRRIVRTHPRSVAARDAVKLAQSIVPRLPAGILAAAPDYAALRQAMRDNAAAPLPADTAESAPPEDRPGVEP